jgi:hypothetical protein
MHFALLGRKRKYIKSKTTAKLKGKLTLIAAVRDQFLSFATFLTLLLSRYRLPLTDTFKQIAKKVQRLFIAGVIDIREHRRSFKNSKNFEKFRNYKYTIIREPRYIALTCMASNHMRKPFKPEHVEGAWSKTERWRLVY